MRTPKLLSTRMYRGYTVRHFEEMRFVGTAPWRPNGWKVSRYWWIVELDEDEPTWTQVKERIDRDFR